MTKVLKVKQVATEINVSVPQVYKLVSLGRFPKPIKLGERGSGWLTSEIDAWLQSKIEERDTEVANDYTYR
jgi:prophage regulatory protein